MKHCPCCPDPKKANRLAQLQASQKSWLEAQTATETQPEENDKNWKSVEKTEDQSDNAAAKKQNKQISKERRNDMKTGKNDSSLKDDTSPVPKGPRGGKSGREDLSSVRDTAKK